VALKSVPTKRFWKGYHSLPENIRNVADEVYKLWKENPFDPALEFHEIRKSLWRIKIGYRYRALARRYEGSVVWIWIGSHEDYNKLIGKEAI